MGCCERRSHGAQRPSLEYGLSQTKRHLTRASRPAALGVRRRRFPSKASLLARTVAYSGSVDGYHATPYRRIRRMLDQSVGRHSFRFESQ
jgi:hypothetical protein